MSVILSLMKKMIWHKTYTLEEVNAIFAKNMTGYLEIKAVAISHDSLVASMPVNDKVKQPYGLLHGGASVVLAESVGSIASNLVVDHDAFMGVGMEINANHLRPVWDGEVRALCRPLHLGAKSHVWDIRIEDQKGNLVCVSRLTVAVVKRRNAND